MTASIYFAHANGFPAASYRKLFAQLQDVFRIEALEMAGHHRDYPVNDNWSNLRDELIADLERRLDRPVIGVGHSLGGVLTLLAAARRPQLFRAVIMLDPPIVMGSSAWLTGLAKRAGLMDRITPAARTLKRRTHWPDVPSAIASLRGKSLFRNFDPHCLHDYLSEGTEPCTQGVRLRFDPAVEAEIFRTIPHTLPRLPALSIPGALIYGRTSQVTRPRDVRLLARRHALRLHAVDGGHMFPFEHPVATARALRETIERLCPDASSGVAA